MCQPKFIDESPRASVGEASKKRKAPSQSSNRTRVLTLEELQENFHLPINEVAAKLGICVTVLKQQCRELGIVRWPYRKVRKLDNMLAALENAGPTKARPFALSNGEEERQRKIVSVKQTLDELMHDPNSCAHLKLGKVKNAAAAAAAAAAQFGTAFSSSPSTTSERRALAQQKELVGQEEQGQSGMEQRAASGSASGDGSAMLEAARALAWGPKGDRASAKPDSVDLTGALSPGGDKTQLSEAGSFLQLMESPVRCTAMAGRQTASPLALGYGSAPESCPQAEPGDAWLGACLTSGSGSPSSHDERRACPRQTAHSASPGVFGAEGADGTVCLLQMASSACGPSSCAQQNQSFSERSKAEDAGGSVHSPGQSAAFEKLHERESSDVELDLISRLGTAGADGKAEPDRHAAAAKVSLSLGEDHGVPLQNASLDQREPSAKPQAPAQQQPEETAAATEPALLKASEESPSLSQGMGPLPAQMKPAESLTRQELLLSPFLLPPLFDHTKADPALGCHALMASGFPLMATGIPTSMPGPSSGNSFPMHSALLSHNAALLHLRAQQLAQLQNQQQQNQTDILALISMQQQSPYLAVGPMGPMAPSAAVAAQRNALFGASLPLNSGIGVLNLTVPGSSTNPSSSMFQAQALQRTPLWS